MEKVPIDETLLTTPLEPVEQVRLKGTKCRNCGEAYLGKRFGCENCGSDDMESVILGKRGKLWSFTTVDAPPPGNYKGGPKDPFTPFGVGLVELPEGCRILTVLTENNPEELKACIDKEVELVVEKLYENEEGNEVVTFKFKPG
ncbi:Zn-ribbon domain-containing OB-fold protein [Chloroflexota bacterium]